jgi:8-oxo-dGTP diphosphatase
MNSRNRRDREIHRTYVIASAVIRRGDEILLVHQYRPVDPYPNWFLPGGRLEPGEVLAEGLLREVREEAGLDLTKVGQLAFCTHAVDAADGSQTLAFVFEVAEWSGTPRSDDPDGTVSEVRWFPLDEAISHLERVPWPSMKAPLIAYLKGAHPAGTVWMFSARGDEQPASGTLVGRVPGPIEGTSGNLPQENKIERGIKHGLHT